MPINKTLVISSTSGSLLLNKKHVKSTMALYHFVNFPYIKAVVAKMWHGLIFSMLTKKID